MAPTPASSTPWRRRTSSARAATLSCRPAQTASSEYVHTRSTNWFSQSELPTASGAESGPISTALIRVDPSSIPSAVRPSAIAAPAPVVMSTDLPASASARLLALTSSRSSWSAARGRHRSGARPDDELRGHGLGVQVLAAQAGQHQLHAAATQLGEVLPHGGERWREVRRLGQVVEADDADVPRHLDVLLVQRR